MRNRLGLRLFHRIIGWLRGAQVLRRWGWLPEFRLMRWSVFGLRRTIVLRLLTSFTRRFARPNAGLASYVLSVARLPGVASRVARFTAWLRRCFTLLCVARLEVAGFTL